MSTQAQFYNKINVDYLKKYIDVLINRRYRFFNLVNISFQV